MTFGASFAKHWTRNEQIARRAISTLGFGNLASLDGFDTDPLALHLAAGKLDPNALHVGTKGTLVVFNQLQTDTATALALAFVNNFASANRTLTCDCAYTCHDLKNHYSYRNKAAKVKQNIRNSTN